MCRRERHCGIALRAPGKCKEELEDSLFGVPRPGRGAQVLKIMESRFAMAQVVKTRNLGLAVVRESAKKDEMAKGPRGGKAKSEGIRRETCANLSQRAADCERPSTYSVVFDRAVRTLFVIHSNGENSNGVCVVRTLLNVG